MRGLAESVGSIVSTFSYDAYGTLASSTGTAIMPFGYAGQYTDEVRLVWCLPEGWDI
jgi:hypothetical protein